MVQFNVCFSQNWSHQGNIFCKIFVASRLLISPMIPLMVCFSAKMVPLRVCFWEKIVPLRVRFSGYSPSQDARWSRDSRLLEWIFTLRS